MFPLKSFAFAAVFVFVRMYRDDNDKQENDALTRICCRALVHHATVSLSLSISLPPLSLSPSSLSLSLSLSLSVCCTRCSDNRTFPWKAMTKLKKICSLYPPIYQFFIHVCPLLRPMHSSFAIKRLVKKTRV
jgi:hypothetical protein